MRLLLIRHAEPDYVRDHLTPKGLREAALLADYLSRTDVDAWYVSPLGRAQATLEPTLARTGRTAQTLLWLEEFRGRCTNPDRPDEMTFPWCLSPRTLQEHPLLMSPHRWHEDSLLYKGNTVEIYDETSQQLDALLSEHGYQRSGAVYRRTDDGEITVALVCHFAISMAIVSLLTGVSPFALWHGFYLAPSSVTVLVTEEYVPGEAIFRCARIGDVSHLHVDGEPMSDVGLNAVPEWKELYQAPCQ